MNSTQSDMDLFRPSLSFNTEQPEITKAFTNSINSNSQSTYFISYGWLNVSHCFLANGWCPWKACHSQDCWNFWDLVPWSILSIVLNSAYLANYFQDFTMFYCIYEVNSNKKWKRGMAFYNEFNRFKRYPVLFNKSFEIGKKYNRSTFY